MRRDAESRFEHARLDPRHPGRFTSALQQGLPEGHAAFHRGAPTSHGLPPTAASLCVADADGTTSGALPSAAPTIPSGRRTGGGSHSSRNGWIMDRARRRQRPSTRALPPAGTIRPGPARRTAQKIAYTTAARSSRSTGSAVSGTSSAAAGQSRPYAPDGRMAFVQDGDIVADGKVVAHGDQPAWAPDSKRLRVPQPCRKTHHLTVEQ